MTVIDEARNEWVRTDDGANLRVRRYGDPARPAIVLSHGWACRLEYWTPQIERLSRRFHVIAYDQRGHGHSTRGQRAVDSDTLADDLAHVIDATEAPSRAVTVGHSMGGIAIQAWWGRHPAQARRTTAAAVLANTTSGGLAHGTRVVPLLNGKVPAPDFLFRRAFAIPVRLPNSRLSREVIRRRVMNTSHATTAQAAFLNEIVSSCDPRVRTETALALADVELGLDAAKAIEVPTTVLVGRVDKVTPPWMGRQIATALAHEGRLEKLVELDTGHAGTLEEPARVNQEIEHIADLHCGAL